MDITAKQTKFIFSIIISIWLFHIPQSILLGIGLYIVITAYTNGNKWDILS